MIVLSIIGGILLECMILGVGIYLGKKYFYKPPVKLKTSIISKNRIEEVLRELQNKKSKNKKVILPERIYSSGMQQERPVKRSGGDLVPYGLSDSEREILEMFYDKD